MATDADLSGIKIELGQNKPGRRPGVSDIEDLDDVFDDPDQNGPEEEEVSLQPITYKTKKDEVKPGSKKGNRNDETDNRQEKTEYSLQPMAMKKRERKEDQKPKESKIKDKLDVKEYKNSDVKEYKNSDRISSDTKLEKLTLKPIGNAKVNKSHNGIPVEKCISKKEVKKDKSVSNHKDVKVKDMKTKKEGDDNTDVRNKELLETIDVPLTKVKSKPKTSQGNQNESRQLHKSTAHAEKQYSKDKSSHTENRNSEQEKMFLEQQKMAKEQRQKERAGKRSVSFNKDTNLNEDIDPNQLTMSKKFQRFARQMSQQSSVSSSFRRKRRKRPNTCFDLALFACCCCCSPLGGIGMILAGLFFVYLIKGNKRCILIFSCKHLVETSKNKQKPNYDSIHVHVCDAQN